MRVPAGVRRMRDVTDLPPGSSTRTTRFIEARREAIYRAFTDLTVLLVSGGRDDRQDLQPRRRSGAGHGMSLFLSSIRAGIPRQDIALPLCVRAPRWDRCFLATSPAARFLPAFRRVHMRHFATVQL